MSLIYSANGYEIDDREVIADLVVYSHSLSTTMDPCDFKANRIFDVSPSGVYSKSVLDGRVTTIEYAYVHFQKRSLVFANADCEYESGYIITPPNYAIPREGVALDRHSIEELSRRVDYRWILEQFKSRTLRKAKKVLGR